MGGKVFRVTTGNFAYFDSAVEGKCRQSRQCQCVLCDSVGQCKPPDKTAIYDSVAQKFLFAVHKCVHICFDFEGKNGEFSEK